MISADSRFWVAEVLKSSAVTVHSEEVGYTLTTDRQVWKTFMRIPDLQEKKIVGTIGLRGCMSNACIKMLYVHKQHRQRKDIAQYLLRTAVNFASDAGYNCINMIASEYREEHRDLCISEGFELKKMYRQPILGFVMSKMIYELTYEIRLNNDIKFCIEGEF